MKRVFYFWQSRESDVGRPMRDVRCRWSPLLGLVIGTMSSSHDPKPVPASFALSQGPSIRALLKVGVTTPFKAGSGPMPATPGPLVKDELPALGKPLLDAYSAWTGGPVARVVPPHLFPQWSFPLLIQALADLPFSMMAVLNQGCRLEISGPLPAGQPLQCTAQLAEVQHEPSGKIKITTTVTTQTASSVPGAVKAHIYAIIPPQQVRTRGCSPSTSLPSCSP